MGKIFCLENCKRRRFDHVKGNLWTLPDKRSLATPMPLFFVSHGTAIRVNDYSDMALQYEEADVEKHCLNILASLHNYAEGVIGFLPFWGIGPNPALIRYSGKTKEEVVALFDRAREITQRRNAERDRRSRCRD